MRKCMNRSHPQVKKMIGELGENLAQYYFNLNNDEPLSDEEIEEIKNDKQGETSKKMTYYQNNTGQSNEDFIASEKTIRDLAARLADRIGMEVRFISDRSKNFKGKLEGNISTINLAYATLDTLPHEILGHPIINQIVKSKPELYNNLLKELESGRGKEVLDRVKRDYVYKYNSKDVQDALSIIKELEGLEAFGFSNEEQERLDKANLVVANTNEKYTLEEQQEEAIVELLGLMTAKKLDDVKDGKLISLLKRLLKEIATFMRNLLRQKEIEVDKLPDNMTLNDLANILAYSNSKIILPGNEVIYTTPDNQTFKTYQEASNHISKLVKSVKEVDLGNIKTVKDNIFKPVSKIPENVTDFTVQYYDKISYFNGAWRTFQDGEMSLPSDEEILKLYNEHLKENFKSEDDMNNGTETGLKGFVEKNKEYEQSREIIEEWKRVNNIQYNPEEIYSRGQGFYSVVGAYSQFDVKLMFQNLLHHIEDNKKAGGQFVISAFTKPIDKTISHLEGGGGKIKFVIYPKSEDILWATNKDAYSGSVWDAGEKVNKDKQSELLGVSYTKYPALTNLSSVQPNLASIIDNLADHHNELGIVLTGNNFRLEVDEDVPYEIKRLVGVINSVLDDTYGKIKKPNINKSKGVRWRVDYQDMTSEREFYFNTEEEALEFIENDKIGQIPEEQVYYSKPFKENFNNGQGIQPTITEKDLKKSLKDIENRLIPKLKDVIGFDSFEYNGEKYTKTAFGYVKTYIDILYGREEDENISEKEYLTALEKYKLEFYKGKEEKEYNEQALINTKIAALKEVAKKYPRSLIRSEVRNTFSNYKYYQKINSEIDENRVNYNLKSINILLSDKAKQVFSKGKKVNWSLDKMLQELQIPKEQKELIKESYNNLMFVGKDEQGKDIVTEPTAEEIALDLLQYAFDVILYTSTEDVDYGQYTIPTEYYSSLTVPGGTNYTENEISTPSITPSIKGHAQFSTDKGIGWFRSDDKYPFTGFLEDLIASGTIKKVPCG